MTYTLKNIIGSLKPYREAAILDSIAAFIFLLTIIIEHNLFLWHHANYGRVPSFHNNQDSL